jgi:hypothetical protein
MVKIPAMRRNAREKRRKKERSVRQFTEPRERG